MRIIPDELYDTLAMTVTTTGAVAVMDGGTQRWPDSTITNGSMRQERSESPSDRLYSRHLMGAVWRCECGDCGPGGRQPRINDQLRVYSCMNRGHDPCITHRGWPRHLLSGYYSCCVGPGFRLLEGKAGIHKKRHVQYTHLPWPDLWHTCTPPTPTSYLHPLSSHAHHSCTTPAPCFTCITPAPPPPLTSPAPHLSHASHLHLPPPHTPHLHYT